MSQKTTVSLSLNVGTSIFDFLNILRSRNVSEIERVCQQCHRRQDLHMKCVIFVSLCGVLGLCFILENENATLFASVCAHVNNCSRYVHHHVLLRLNHNETDNSVVNEQWFPFVVVIFAPYPCYLSLGPRDSCTPLLSYPRICAVNTHWLLF